MEKHIRFDWAMKRLLRKKANFVILEGFLSELLKQDVIITEILESSGNKEHETDKYNVVDILVKNTQGELMLIEVQNNKEVDYFHRMNYGQAKLLTGHISAGVNYDQIKKVYSINIVYFDLGQGKDYIYKGTTDFIGLHTKDTLQLSQQQLDTYPIENIADIFTTYYMLRVNSFDDIAKNTLDEWIYFLKNSEIKDEFKAKGLKEAKLVMSIINMSDDEKYEYDRFIKSSRISMCEIKTAKLDGRAEAKEELMPIIEKERRQKEEAQLQTKKSQEQIKSAHEMLRTTIKNLQNTGMSKSEIAKILGLTMEELDKLLNS